MDYRLQPGLIWHCQLIEPPGVDLGLGFGWSSESVLIMNFDNYCEEFSKVRKVIW